MYDFGIKSTCLTRMAHRDRETTSQHHRTISSDRSSAAPPHPVTQEDGRRCRRSLAPRTDRPRRLQRGDGQPQSHSYTERWLALPTQAPIQGRQKLHFVHRGRRRRSAMTPIRAPASTQVQAVWISTPGQSLRNGAPDRSTRRRERHRTSLGHLLVGSLRSKGNSGSPP